MKKTYTHIHTKLCLQVWMQLSGLQFVWDFTLGPGCILSTRWIQLLILLLCFNYYFVFPCNVRKYTQNWTYDICSSKNMPVSLSIEFLSYIFLGSDTISCLLTGLPGSGGWRRQYPPCWLGKCSVDAAAGENSQEGAKANVQHVLHLWFVSDL